jgi:hypothetical protein
MTEVNAYLLIGINGFCTGIGVIMANFVFENFIRKRLIKIQKKVKRIIKIK